MVLTLYAILRAALYHLAADHPRAPSLFEAGDPSHLPDDPSHLPVDPSHLSESDPTLQAIAQTVAGKGKAPVSEVRGVLLVLCRGRYLTADVLAKLLNRTAANLRNRYLTPMVTEGLLRLRYPETPSRPDQAYTAVDANP